MPVDSDARQFDASGATMAYPEAMPSIQVKDVPAEVHATLRRRAAIAGQSLQEYLLEHLTAEATTPTLGELFANVEQHTGGDVPFEAAVEAIRVDRLDT